MAALTAVLDACALVIARIEDKSSTTARLTFAIARHAVVDLCSVFRLEPTFPAVDRLPALEQERLEIFLAAEGVRLRTNEASVGKLRALRAMYEPYVNALSRFLLMPLPDWMPPERESESWHVIA